MPDMLVRQLDPDDFEPDLLAIALPILRTWEAAALRVAANHTAPKQFALPKDKNTPEAILGRRFRQIAKGRPQVAQAASAIAVDQLSLPKTQKRLGRTVNLNFSTKDSVDDLVVAAKPPADPAALLRLVDRHYTPLGLQRTTSGAISPEGQVRLDLIRVVCVDETNGFLGSEWGDDEISLSAATIDEGGNTAKVDPFKVGDFSDGDREDFDPPKTIYTWNVGGGRSYPKHYFATMFLFEEDQGDLDESFEQMFRKFAQLVAEKLAELTGQAVGAYLESKELGEVARALIAWLAGWLLNKLVSFLISVWEDDPFIPRQLEFIIPTATARMDEPSKVFHFRGPGEYAVRYRWSVAGRTVGIGT